MAILHADLAHRTMNDVFVQPFRGDMVAIYCGGPVLGESSEDRRLRHTRYWQPVDCFQPDLVPQIQLDSTYVYSGPIYHHFGHIMAEMVHRIIPGKILFALDKWLFVNFFRKPLCSFDDIPIVFRNILEFLEIGPASVTVINADTTVKHLHIVEQGSDLGGGPKPGYLDDLAEFVHPRLDRRYDETQGWARVYVSRSGLSHGGSFLGERYLEQALAAEGFHIFHPQQVPLPLQMQVYRRAKVLIFSEGSACHGTELLGSDALGDVFVLLRRASHQEIFANVLRPRARSYAACTMQIPVGSIVARHGSSKPLEEFAVSLFDVDALLAFLRETGIARLPGFRRDTYLECAEADLLRYIENYVVNDSPLFGPALIPDVLRSFNEKRGMFREPEYATRLFNATGSAEQSPRCNPCEEK
jgi:hypothetical protein